jgi:ABC-2 type transport system ATP-binding protein
MDLSKTYRGSETPALNRISLSITGNEIFGLLGPNGAGKTTTLHILCGFIKKDAGSVVMNGLTLEKNERDFKKIIGLVPQEIAVYESLTPVENLRFYGKMYGLEPERLNYRISECLALMGLEKSRNKLVKTFSGGMKRRLNLIAGILHEPSILFLDEPTVGVDVQSRTVILDHLKELNAKGMTIIYTSHYLEEAEQFCSTVAIIDAGQIIVSGRPKELIRSVDGCNSLEMLYLHITGRKLRDN